LAVGLPFLYIPGGKIDGSAQKQDYGKRPQGFYKFFHVLIISHLGQIDKRPAVAGGPVRFFAEFIISKPALHLRYTREITPKMCLLKAKKADVGVTSAFLI
jgi:hypothetical protein